MFLIEGVLGSKNLFCESCSQHPYYYREVISVFWFGGSKTCLPSPEGGRQIKSCSDGKTCLAKVDRSAQVTIKKWPPFFDLGSVSWPQRRCRRCGVAGGAALQAVSECPRRRQAGIWTFLVIRIAYKKSLLRWLPWATKTKFTSYPVPPKILATCHVSSHTFLF